jgi:hypothetical protein
MNAGGAGGGKAWKCGIGDDALIADLAGGESVFEGGNGV